MYSEPWTRAGFHTGSCTYAPLYGPLAAIATANYVHTHIKIKVRPTTCKQHANMKQ